MIRVSRIVKLLICLILFFAIGASIPLFAQSDLVQMKEIHIDEGRLFVEFNNGTPEVALKIYEEEGKILIELMETQYDEEFVFDLPLKRNILNNLEFLEDVSVGKARYGTDLYKVGIWLSAHKDDMQYPKLFQKGSNYVVISFTDESNLAVTEEESVTVGQNDTNASEIEELLLKDNELKSEEEKIREKEEEITSLYNQAIEQHSLGRYEEAKSLYEEVLSIEPVFDQAAYNLARLYIDLGEYDEAISRFRDLVKHYSDSGDDKMFLLISNAIGVIHYIKGDLDKALDIFTELKSIQANFYETYYNLGLVYEQQYDVKKAKINFKKTIELKQDYLPAYYHLGVLNLLEHDKKEAIVNFEKVIEINPDSKFSKLSQNELQQIK